MPDGTDNPTSPAYEPAERGDPAWGFAYVVVPVVAHLFGAGEVGSVRVVTAVREGGRELRLYIDALGDSGSSV